MPKLGDVYVSYAAKGLDQMDRDIKTAELSFRNGATAIAGSVLAMGASMAGLAAKFGTEFDKVESEMMASIGNIEKNMAITKELFRSGLVDGIEEAGLQATAAIRAFGNETEAEIRSSLKFGAAIAEQFKVDAPELFSGAKTLIDNFKISSEQALDIVAAGFEKGLNRSGDFLESINEYATQFSSAGANVGQFFSILETGMQGGVLGTDKAADAFKEFRVRIQDGSKTTEESLAKIGLSVADVNKSLTTGGKTVTDVFGDVISRLRETDDSTVQMQAGVGLLGTQFEDLGTAAVLSLDLAKTGLDDVAGSAKKTFDTTQTAQRLFDQLVNEGILIAVDVWDKYEGRVKIALASTLEFVKENREWPIEMIDSMSKIWDMLNVGFISLLDAGGRTFIELENAGSIAWAAIQDVAGTAISEMLKGLASMHDAAGEAAAALGQYDIKQTMVDSSRAIRMVARDLDDWSTNLEKASTARKNSLDSHNKIIAAMVSERAEYSGISEAAKKSNAELDKIRAARVANTEKALGEIVKAEEKKTATVKTLTVKEQKDISDLEGKRVKDHEKMLDEILKLEEQQAKELEKTLDDSQKSIENFIKFQLDTKELSAETLAEIDREYQRIFEGLQEGSIESFNAAMSDILDGKIENIEALKANDALYSAFLREQEIANKEIRLEFYGEAGRFSQEHYDSEMERINAYTERLRAAGVDAVDIEKVKTDQIRDLDIKKLESSGSFFDGVKAQMLQNEKDTADWTKAGKDIYNTFVNETSKAFSTLINSAIKGDMDALKGAWDNLWQGMLGKVVDIIAQMAAEWAAQQITTGAMSLIDMLTAEDGVFDAKKPSGQPTVDNRGGFLAVLHPNETVLSEDLTNRFKEATGWEEARQTVLDYFGISSDDNAPGFFDTVGDYSGAGKSLYDAWMAFQDGDNTGGSIAMLNAIKEGLTTYAANATSQSAANLSGGLGGFAGALGSGLGAWQSFQDENYAQGIMQTLQTIDQAITAYETLTAAGSSTISASSTAGLTAAEQAAASSAGSTSSSLGSIIEGAGWGGAIWSLFTLIAGDEHMQSSLASTGATLGATIGSIAGSTVPGVGNVIGGAFGAAAGGLIGTIADVAQGGSERFEVDDLNSIINNARTWTDDGWAGSLNPVQGDTGSAHGNARNTYLAATQASMDLATATIATVTATFGEEVGRQFQAVFAANLDPVEAGGNSWQIGQEGRGANTAARLAATYWNDTADAIAKAARSLQDVVAGPEEDFGVITNPMTILALWAEDNMVPPDVLIDPTGAAQAETAISLQGTQARRSAAAHAAGRGAATGGIVVPTGEDGILAVQKDEGIFPVPALKWAEDIGKMIERGGLFGGQFPEFDTRIESRESPEITVTFPDDMGRSNMFSELYLSDIVSNTTGANSRLDTVIERLERLVAINMDIAAKPVPRIGQNELVGFVAPGVGDQIRTGRVDIGLRDLEHRILYAFGRD